MKLYQKIIAGVLVVALSAGGTLAYAESHAGAAEDEKIAVGVAQDVKQVPVKTNNGQNAEKKEVVYVFCGADGSRQRVMVTDTLTNPDGLASIRDVSCLTGISNVKGNEEFTQNGSELVWEAAGSDICYQGITDEQTPVSVKVRYFLDGTELTAEEIAGKSGKVTIRFEYVNHQSYTVQIGGKQQEVAVPFAVVSGVFLDSDKYTNIQVTNGRLVSQGSICAAILVGMPGVAESLGLDTDAGNFAEITADTADFSLTNTFTVATNSPFAKISLDDSLNPEQLADALSALRDATNELADGTVRLYEGAGKLKDGVKKLADGVKKLLDGAIELSDHMAALAEGAKTLTQGAKTLAESMMPFIDGLKSAKDGASQLAAGIGQLNTGATAFDAGIAAVGSGAGKLATGSEGLKNGAAQVQQGAAGLNAGIAGVQDGLNALDQGVDTAYTSLVATISYNQQVLAGMTQFFQVYGANLDAATAASLQTMIGTLGQTIAAQQQIADSMTGEGALKSGVAALTAGTTQLATGAETLEAGSTAVAEGAAELDDGIDQLAAKVPELTEGWKSIYGGIGQLGTGADALNSGLATLVNAGDQLQEGADSLYEGAVTLGDGADQLAAGSVSLRDGIAELSDGSAALENGAEELYDGTQTLKTGMAQYKEEGIGKILDAVEETDLTEIYDKLKALIDAAADYNSFTGTAQGVNGSVTFIIRTEAVNQ